MDRRYSAPLLATTLAIGGLATSCGGATPPAYTYQERTEATGTRKDLEETDDALKWEATRFFKNPTLRHLSLSPDGKHLAGVHRRDGADVIVALPLDGGALKHLAIIKNYTERDEPRFVYDVDWASNEMVGVALSEKVRVGYAVPVRRYKRVVIPLVPEKPTERFREIERGVIHWMPWDSESVVVNDYHAKIQSIRTGRMKKIPGAFMHHGKAVGWRADHRARVRFATTSRVSDRTSAVGFGRGTANGSFEELWRYDIYDDPGIHFACFTEQDGTMMVLADHDGRYALFEYDIAAKALQRLVFSHPRYDIYACISSEKSGRLIGAAYLDEKIEAKWFDPEWQGVADDISRRLPGASNVVLDRDLDEDRLLIASHADRQPTKYYVLDRRTGQFGMLFDSAEGIAAEELSPMKPISYPARDGKTIRGYLTLPRYRRPENGYPTIVLPHGGPRSRDVWGWSAEVQFLVSRGFAVMQPNFRGSTGYGIEFERSGLRQWGLSMQDDVHDGARWLIESGVSDPERIGIYGASFGGYTALMGAIKDPGLFKAIASLAGISDIVDLLGDEAHTFWSVDDYNSPTIGGRYVDREQLRATSPALHVDRIVAPIFLAAGGDDNVVDPEQTEIMAAALKQAGKPVEVVMYKDELHTFMDERNRIDFYTKLAAFFEKHLMKDLPAAPAAETASN